MTELKAKIFSLIQSNEMQFIPPMVKLSQEIDFLQRLLLRKPIHTRVADPATWYFDYFKKRYDGYEPDALLERLELYRDYLAINSTVGTVFSNEYSLQQNDSIPYFEWNMSNQYYAISDFLGHSFIIILDLDVSDSEIISLLQSLNDHGDDHRPISVLFFHDNRMHSLDKSYNGIRLSAVDLNLVNEGDFNLRYKIKTKGTLGLFGSTNKSLLLINNKGKLQGLYSKQDIAELVEAIQL